MFRIVVLITVVLSISGCGSYVPSSDDVQRKQQELILKEGTAAVGMPSIKNFREKRLLKDILELRDQDGLVTYTYIVAENTGKLVFLGESLGYGIPAATQFTNPQKFDLQQLGTDTQRCYSGALPQADPNGLFSPSSAEGTWVMMKDPNGKTVKPVYIEPRIIVSPFRLSMELEK